jgi:6,7-dimethyl-8-ribityllumazine synthase
MRLAIVAARFNREVTDLMLDEALARAKEKGVDLVSVVRVPGVFEIPLAVQRLLERSDVDAAVAIGAVIKGETLHDEALMAAVPRALLEVELRAGKPVGLGITGPGMTDEQAAARVDKGAEAVDAALAMHEILQGLGPRS